MSTGRRPISSAGSSPQQASRFSGLRGRPSQQPSASTSRQGSGQLPLDDRSASASQPGSGLPQQAGSTTPLQSSPAQSLSNSLLRPQSSQPPLLKPQGSLPQWQSNIAYSPQSSVTSQQSNRAAGVPLSILTQQGSTPLVQQSSTQGIRFTSTPRLVADPSIGSEAANVPGGMAYEGTLQQPEGSQQHPAIEYSANAGTYLYEPRLQVRQPHSGDPFGSSVGQTSDFTTQGNVPQPQGSAEQPQGYLLQPQGSIAQPSSSINPLVQQSSAASQQTEAGSSTAPGGLRGQLQQGSLQEPRTVSDIQRQSWFQDGLSNDAQDPNLHNPRCVLAYKCTSLFFAPHFPVAQGNNQISRTS